MYKNNVFTNIKIKNKSKKKQKCKGNAGMTASLHPFRPLSARLDAHVKKSAAGLTVHFKARLAWPQFLEGRSPAEF